MTTKGPGEAVPGAPLPVTPTLDEMLPEAEMCAAMEADTSFADWRVTEVRDGGDAWDVRLDKPTMDWISIRKALIARPIVGTMLRLFGDGDEFLIRGVAVQWTVASKKFRGVYYRRDGLRCECGDFGWNHKGDAGPCLRIQLTDGTRATCVCQGYRPVQSSMGAPADRQPSWCGNAAHSRQPHMNNGECYSLSAPLARETCRDCGTAINAGEAKVFGVCDACWDKVYQVAAPAPNVGPVDTGAQDVGAPMTTEGPGEAPILGAVAGLESALAEIAATNGSLCHTCGSTVTECSADRDPDRCPGRIARAALAQWDESQKQEAE